MLHVSLAVQRGLPKRSPFASPDSMNSLNLARSPLSHSVGYKCLHLDSKECLRQGESGA